MLQINPASPPTEVVLDFETALLSGGGSVEFYRHDFRVLSCSFSWQNPDQSITSEFVLGEDEIARDLSDIARLKIPVIVHNLSFEYGVCLNRFPELADTLIWSLDTMRLTQVGDNGQILKTEVSEYLEENVNYSLKREGLSLEACITRWLPSYYWNHKQPFYEVLRSQFQVKKGLEGANLHLLSPDQLKQYNTLDTELTLRLALVLRKYFEGEIRYDYTLDHYFYMEMSKLISAGKNRGVHVLLNDSKQNSQTLGNLIQDIEARFYETFKGPISEIEAETKETLLGLRKTDKGKQALLIAIEKNPKLYKFNVGSQKQKQKLFIDKLGLLPKFFTKKGAPSFSRHFLSQWGEGGVLLSKFGTLSLTKHQLDNLIEKSEYDSRWHIDLMAAGTSTGRFKGRGE